MPTLTGQDGERGDGRARRVGPDLKVEETRRSDPKIPAGQILTQDPQAGVRTRRAAQRQGLGQRRAAVDHRAGAARRIRAHGAAPAAAGRPGAGRRSRRSARRTTRPTSSSRRRRRRKSSGGTRRAARQPRRARRDLRDARPDRRQRRSRGRPAARRAASASSVVGDHPYPGVPAGIVLRQSPQAGFQIAPGRADLARGQPLSGARPDCAVASLPPTSRAAATQIAARRARRRRPDSRRRHGRPLRAEPHDRPAGRASRSGAWRHGAARRAPDDRRTRIATSRRSSRPGARDLAVHVEVLPHLHRTIQAIKELGVRRRAWRSTRPRRSARSRRSPAISTTCW